MKIKSALLHTHFVTALFACTGLVLPAPVHAAQADKTPPTAAEQAELARHKTYTGYIHLIESNEETGVLEFLKENTGRTVFIDSAVLRYSPAPEDLTEETRDRIAPTDRFENIVVKKCWGPEINMAGRLKSGETGFPLPENEADIQSGCKTRIRIEMVDDGHGGNLAFIRGFDKNEIFFAGFFTVQANTLPDGKTLYRLIETRDMPQETVQAFYTHAAAGERPYRKLDIETASGEDSAPATPENGKAE